MSWLCWAKMTRGPRRTSRGTPRCSPPATGGRRSASSPRGTPRSWPGSPCSTRSCAPRPTNLDAVQVRAHNEQLRRDGYARIVAHLAGRFGLRPGLDPAHAVDILLTLAGPATYRALAVDYGWPHDGFVDWLATTLGQQLLAPEARPGPRHH